MCHLRTCYAPLNLDYSHIRFWKLPEAFDYQNSVEPMLFTSLHIFGIWRERVHIVSDIRLPACSAPRPLPVSSDSDSFHSFHSDSGCQWGFSKQPADSSANVLVFERSSKHISWRQTKTHKPTWYTNIQNNNPGISRGCSFSRPKKSCLHLLLVAIQAILQVFCKALLCFLMIKWEEPVVRSLAIGHMSTPGV